MSLILVECFQRDKLISGQVEAARNKMRQIGVNVEAVEAEYEKKLKRGLKRFEVEEEVPADGNRAWLFIVKHILYQLYLKKFIILYLPDV